MRQAIRDAVNRSSRKPFAWGGLSGYQQLTEIAQALHNSPSTRQSDYLSGLLEQVERVLDRNRDLAEDVQAAHQGLTQVARCLHYPLSPHEKDTLTSQQISQAVEHWIKDWQPAGLRQQAQIDLGDAVQKRWRLYGPELLPCYDLPGLPQDNLQLEACFGRLRRHQRRISGRRSTRPLQDFGQVQVLFQADSQAELLQQIQRVPTEVYLTHRQRLAQAESSRQFLRRLHHDSLATIQILLRQHTACQKPLSPESIPFIELRQ